MLLPQSSAITNKINNAYILVVIEPYATSFDEVYCTGRRVLPCNLRPGGVTALSAQTIFVNRFSTVYMTSGGRSTSKLALFARHVLLQGECLVKLCGIFT